MPKGIPATNNPASFDRNLPLSMLLISSISLLVLGIIMIASASIDVAAAEMNDGFYYIIRQAIFVVMGLIAAFTAVNIPIAWWERSGLLLLGVGFLLLIAVLTPLGKTVNGSTRWIPVGLFNIQVSEIAKVCLIAYLAGYLVRRREEFFTSWMGFFKPLMVLGLASFLLVTQPDFGATVVLMAAASGMIFLTGVQLTRFVPLILLLGIIGTILIVTQPYRIKRVVSYLDPWKDQFDSGYQLTQSLIAFGRGEWTGMGLGNSIQKLFFLPEAHTDFIFSIIAEELGLIGSLVVLALFTALFVSGFMIARRAEKDGMHFGAFFSYGLTLIFGLQSTINIGVSTGLLPTKGLTLPLVSYGGSSLLVMCMCIGILIRVEVERLDRRRHPETPDP